MPVARSGRAPPPRTSRAAISALKAYVVANTEDVGRRFPEVARRIHYGEEDAARHPRPS